jgi:hypothetical protein
MPPSAKSPQSTMTTVARLRGTLDRHGGSVPLTDSEKTTTGSPPLDRLLPGGGLRRGSLVEYLGQGVSLAFAAAQAACRDRPLVVVDRGQALYPASWPIELAQTVLVRPTSEADEIWACDQSLRCPGVGAVLARCGRLGQRDFRRLQLAAEEGRTLGILVRPVKLRGDPTWADVQWLVEPQPSPDRWRLRVELLRCRGGSGGGSLTLELDDTNIWQEVEHAHSLPAPAILADSTAPRHRARA